MVAVSAHQSVYTSCSRSQKGHSVVPTVYEPLAVHVYKYNIHDIVFVVGNLWWDIQGRHCHNNRSCACMCSSMLYAVYYCQNTVSWNVHCWSCYSYDGVVWAVQKLLVTMCTRVGLHVCLWQLSKTIIAASCWRVFDFNINVMFLQGRNIQNIWSLVVTLFLLVLNSSGSRALFKRELIVVKNGL